MTLNTREKKIAWAVGGVLVLYVIYSYIITGLYLDPLRDLDSQIAKRKQTIKTNNELVANRGKVHAQWEKLVNAGLGDDSAVVTSKISQDFETMLVRCRILRTELKPEKPVENQKTDFSEIPFTLRFNTASANLSNFLYSLETSGLPIRVESLGITSNKPGQDDLIVDLKIMSLLYSPKGPNTRIVGTRPSTRPVAGRGSATQPGSGMSTIARPTMTPAAPTAAAAPAAASPGGSSGPKTAEQLEAEMKARRARENGEAVETPAVPASTQPGGVR